MNIGFSSDHRGYELKQMLINKLREKGYNIIDCGTDSIESVDYPIYAFKLCKLITNREIDLGIAICGTGIGMSIACNKVKGIRCAKIDNVQDAEYAKEHNNANILAISANKSSEEITEMLETFINQSFSSNEKHKRRIQLIEDYENAN